MIDKDKLNEMLDASPAERVTKEYKEYMESRIPDRITDTKFQKLGETLTQCAILVDTHISTNFDY